MVEQQTLCGRCEHLADGDDGLCGDCRAEVAPYIGFIDEDAMFRVQVRQPTLYNGRVRYRRRRQEDAEGCCSGCELPTVWAWDPKYERWLELEEVSDKSGKFIAPVLKPCYLCNGSMVERFRFGEFPCRECDTGEILHARYWGWTGGTFHRHKCKGRWGTEMTSETSVAVRPPVEWRSR